MKTPETEYHAMSASLKKKKKVDHEIVSKTQIKKSIIFFIQMNFGFVELFTLQKKIWLTVLNSCIPWASIKINYLYTCDKQLIMLWDKKLVDLSQILIL